MRILVLFILAGVLSGALAGCTGDDDSELDCRETDTWGRITSHEGDTLEVVLMDGSPGTLHIEEADVFQKLSAGCYEAPASGLEPGKEISFDAKVWAESYPPQAWPTVVILL